MTTKVIRILVFLIVFVLFLLGDREGDTLEIHNNAATMCMACIGLE